MHTRIALLFCLSLALAVPAAAQTKTPEPPAHPPAAASFAPKEIAKFDDWTAATHQEGIQTVCYALTRVQSSTPSVTGRGEVVLTVTERPAARDTVAIAVGPPAAHVASAEHSGRTSLCGPSEECRLVPAFEYPKDANVTMQVDRTGLDFFTRQNVAYARDNASAVAAFQKGERAIARSLGPKGQVTDTFSLKGFSAAYAAIVKACPPPKG